MPFSSDLFGLKALIENKPRAANVIAKGELTVAAMDVATFERLMVRLWIVYFISLSSFI